MNRNSITTGANIMASPVYTSARRVGAGHGLSAMFTGRFRNEVLAIAIADTYLHVLMQPRSTRTWEVELRPWVERF